MQAALLAFVLLGGGVFRREIDAHVLQDVLQVVEGAVGQFQIRQLRADCPVEPAYRDHRPLESLGAVPRPQRNGVFVDHSLGRLAVILFALRSQPCQERLNSRPVVASVSQGLAAGVHKRARFAQQAQQVRARLAAVGPVLDDVEHIQSVERIRN